MSDLDDGPGNVALQTHAVVACVYGDGRAGPRFARGCSSFLAREETICAQVHITLSGTVLVRIDTSMSHSEQII